MLGLRERAEVGVDGIEDTEEKEREYVNSEGNTSLNFIAERSGEGAAEVGALAGVLKPPADETWCRGEAGRRRRGKVFPWYSWRLDMLSGTVRTTGRGVMSSS
jgi:hypothetical protein